MKKEIRPKQAPTVITFEGIMIANHYERVMDMHIEQILETLSILTLLKKDNPGQMLEILHKTYTKIETALKVIRPEIQI